MRDKSGLDSIQLRIWLIVLALIGMLVLLIVIV